MRKFLLLLSAFCFLPSVSAQQRDFTRWVNPFIGTGSHGHTFPGATLPFGMVQVSPDTRIDNWDGSSGYHYSDNIIYGFSHTHLSGTGIPDGCDILFMPTQSHIHAPPAKPDDKDVKPWGAKFSHANEKAEPGYYSVKLDDDNILVELTSTKRVGFHRYTFSRNWDTVVRLDLNWRDKRLDSDIRIVNDTTVEGFRTSSSWAKKQTVYFVAQFSRPFRFRTKDALVSESTSLSREDQKFAWSDFPFNVGQNESLLLKVAISYVSIEGARKNLEAELPHWDFDKVRADAKTAWNKELSKIEVSGGTDEQTTNFYTALYHTMIHPNVFNDVDGRYKGHDGKVHSLSPPASPTSSNDVVRGYAAEGRRSRNPVISSDRKSGAFPHTEGQSPEEQLTQGQNTEVQILGQGHHIDVQGPVSRRNPKSKIQNPKSEQYTVFSLWDTFRAAHPLYTIIDQKRTVDFINTFIRQYEQGGRLPVWELWGEETDTMIGYHAVSVIADAMAKDIKGFDYDKAYEAAKHSAELDHFGLAAYKKRGYISSEDENESVSKTLEYAYNDWCLMSMASTLFNRRSFSKESTGSADSDPYLKRLSEDIERYKRRSGNFENLFDTETRFFRPRLNGGFIKPFAPEEVTFHFTEGNSWQYSFFVPHDVDRLMHLVGGTSKFVAKLDELFTTETKLSGREQPDITGLMGQYAHGNEPSHHIAYLYNYAGRPSKTQHRVRRIMDEFYKPTPDGLIGNEDCGQMSAWYVLSASGFYSTLPGEKRYDLGTPLFKQIVFNLENGKKFIIRAPKVSPANFYINSAKWNGAKHRSSYITHDHIKNGGVLELDMRDTPNDKAFESFSSSSVFRGVQPAVPVIDSPRVFDGSARISMRTHTKDALIFYTIDGTTPTRSSAVYHQPIVLTSPATIKAFAYSSPGNESPVVEAHVSRRPNDWTVKLVSTYSSQYPGGGDSAVIDGLRGTANFAAGEWQGYQGKTFEAVIDLQRETEIRTLGGSFLQVARSWIWIPDRVEFETSTDGINYTRVAEIKPNFPPQEMNPTIREIVEDVRPTRARYVRVRAHNFGKIPAWHIGAGGDPWIFVDEIFVK